jgi:hypothetical protein
VRSFYRLVMNPDLNPLSKLPRAQSYQIMIYLSLMWTAIFCAATGAWLWYGELIVGHAIVALGVLVTGFTFHRANRRGIYRNHPLEDGTARYEDTW